MGGVSTKLPGALEALEVRLLRTLAAAGKRGLELPEMTREVSAELTPEALEEILGGLRSRGEVTRRGRRWVSVRATRLVAGTLQDAGRGHALLRTGERGEAGYFVRRQARHGALAGDRVLARPLPQRRRRQLDGLPEAAVEEVLDRRRRRFVGTVDASRGRPRLVPFDSRLKTVIELEGRVPDSPSTFVVAELSTAAPGAEKTRARVVEILGEALERGVDVEVVLRHFDIPEEFPSRVVTAAASLPEDPRPEEWDGRLDLRDRVVVTIDGETARDFDDAISLERTKSGFRLGVHIADVANYVGEGSELDLEAFRRGTSVYFPDRAVPMLPERLSNGLCSLRPEVPRLTMSAFLDISNTGKILRREFAESVIRSRRRLTYTEVGRVLEEPRSGDEADYGEVLPLLRDARELMEAMLAIRIGRGSIDFDLPEGDVILDTDGYTLGIQPGQRTVAHRIVEEFMIAANEAVAAELVRWELPAVYRVHEPPGRESMDELSDALAAIGIPVRGDLESLHPSVLQDVLARAEGHPEEGLVSMLVLRSMQRAVYSPDCDGHFALASRRYCHFTSPIRRYPDLVVHRQLKASLRGLVSGEDHDDLAGRLPGIADHSSDTERRAERAERELLQWKKVRFLAPRVGETLPGRVTGVTRFGLFVQLDGLFVDGLVHISALTDDHYRFEPEGYRLVGSRKQRVFRLGQALEVRLAAVDEGRRGLDLEVPGMPRRQDVERRRGTRPGRSRRRG